MKIILIIIVSLFYIKIYKDLNKKDLEIQKLRHYEKKRQEGEAL